MHTAPNGKRYIGITRQSVDRRWRHGFGYKRNKHFYSAIIKYGWDNIEHTILSEGETEENALLMEAEYISKYQTNNKRYGYNHTDGGEGTVGCTPPEESRKKMSLSRSGEKNYLYGKHLTEEAKKKISEAHVEYCKSAEVKSMMREVNPNKKPVYQYSTDGELIKIWESSHQAANELVANRTSSAIRKCCQGDCNGAYGYVWSYSPLSSMPIVAGHRKVYQYNTNGEFIKEWVNLQDAVNGYRPNQKSTVIKQCVTGHRRVAYSYAWSYNPPTKAGERVG